MQLMSVRNISRTTLIWRALVIALVIGGVVGGWLGYKPAVARYQQWKQQRALDQARDFLAENDFASAKLALDVALTTAPGNLEALRVAAELLEAVGSPQVMSLRRRILLLDPDSVEDRSALVTSALRFGDLNAARDALGGMRPASADDPVALKAALAYATATDNKPVADALFDRLKQLEPDNQNLQVMHAVLRLRHPRPEVAAAARTELLKLAQQPRHALYIHRELMVEAMLRQDTAAALRHAESVVTDPAATLRDHLHRANLALNAEQRYFDDVFAALAKRASGQASDVAELVQWLLTLGRATEADAWLETLPGNLREAPAVAAARAEVTAARQDWDALAPLLEAGAWGRVQQDTVRLAFATRIATERKNPALQRQLWDEALGAAGGSLADLSLLYRLSALWGWGDLGERTLWVIVRNLPDQAWAHQTLFNAYRQRKDTENMRTLLGTLREGDATLVRYKYDWALLSMLTFRTQGASPAKQTMEELYRSEPANAFYATGQAFALAQSDKGEEALEVLEKLPSTELELPARAPYLAFIYGVARDKERFEQVAVRQPQLTGLLPEENALFTLGRDALTRPEVRKAPQPRPIESVAEVDETKPEAP